MEAAVGSLKESLPSDLAPRVDETAQKLETGRKGGKQINEARHILRELGGEILARAGEFSNLLLDELKKNPAVSKEEMQQKVEDSPNLTKPQKLFFEKAVEIADEDRKSADSVKNNVKTHALEYLEEIYGKDKIPFTQEQINTGDPKVLGAIIFAERSKVLPKGEIILMDNPLVVELAIKNPGDINEIYDPATDTANAGHHQTEVDKIVDGFYTHANIKKLPVVSFIVISDDKNAPATHRHEFGHYLNGLYSRAKKELVQAGRPKYEDGPTVEMVGIEQKMLRDNTDTADNFRRYNLYANDFKQKQWDSAKDELVADFSGTGTYSRVSQRLIQKQDLGKTGQPDFYSFYYRAFSKRFNSMPEQAKKIVLESQEEYYGVLTEQIDFATKVVSAKNRFGWEPRGEEKFTALMNQYPLPQWKTQMEKVFGKEELEELIQIELRFDTIFDQLEEKDKKGGILSKLELYSKVPSLFLIYRRLKSGLSAGQNPKEVFNGVKKDFEKIEKSLGINQE